jgi:hypothetical protein
MLCFGVSHLEDIELVPTINLPSTSLTREIQEDFNGESL